MKKFSIWTRLWIRLGLLSECCGASVTAWDYRHHFCDDCGEDC